MNQEYKPIIENLIKLIKDKGGKIFVNDYASFFQDYSPKTSAVITTFIINDFILIRKKGQYYHLTQDGWNFNNFANIEGIQNLQQQLAQLELDNASFQKKSKYWPHAIALLAVLISIISFVVDFNDSKTINESVNNLEKKVKVLENKIAILESKK